jgi:hypothetical protein
MIKWIISHVFLVPGCARITATVRIASRPARTSWFEHEITKTASLMLCYDRNSKVLGCDWGMHDTQMLNFPLIRPLVFLVIIAWDRHASRDVRVNTPGVMIHRYKYMYINFVNMVDCVPPVSAATHLSRLKMVWLWSIWRRGLCRSWITLNDSWIINGWTSMERTSTVHISSNSGKHTMTIGPYHWENSKLHYFLISITMTSLRQTRYPLPCTSSVLKGFLAGISIILKSLPNPLWQPFDHIFGSFSWITCLTFGENVIDKNAQRPLQQNKPDP